MRDIVINNLNVIIRITDNGTRYIHKVMNGMDEWSNFYDYKKVVESESNKRSSFEYRKAFAIVTDDVKPYDDNVFAFHLVRDEYGDYVVKGIAKTTQQLVASGCYYDNEGVNIVAYARVRIE